MPRGTICQEARTRHQPELPTAPEITPSLVIMPTAENAVPPLVITPPPAESPAPLALTPRVADTEQAHTGAPAPAVAPPLDPVLDRLLSEANLRLRQGALAGAEQVLAEAKKLAPDAPGGVGTGG